MAVFNAYFGASAAANTALLQAIIDQAASNDTILLPAAGMFPLQVVAQSGGRYNAGKITKALTLRGAGSLPTSLVLIPEFDSATEASTFNAAFPYLFDLGDNFDVTLQNFTIDCLWLKTNSGNMIGGWQSQRGTKTVTDIMVRNSRTSWCTHSGSTLAVTRFVGENPGALYPTVLGGNHGFDCDGNTSTSTATTGTVTDSLFTNQIGDALKLENSNTVTLTKNTFRGRVVLGQNDAASAMAFGAITFNGNDFWSLVVLGDDVAGAAHSVGAAVTLTANRFHEDAALLITGGDQTETAKYGEAGANEIVPVGNHFMGRNSIVEFFGTAVPATAGGVVFRDANFAGRNHGVNAALTRFVRPAALPPGTSVSMKQLSPYITSETGSTSVANIESAANAGDDVYYLPGTYTQANSGVFNTTLVKACRHVFAPGAVFDGQNLAIARMFSLAPTTGTLSLHGKLVVKDILTTSGFGGVIDANISAGAAVYINDLEIDHVERASGSALYGAAVRTRGGGSFSFGRMAVKNSKSGDTTNGGDGAFFAFEHTAGGISGGVLELVDNQDRGTDARSGLISFKLGANTFDISAILALRNPRVSGAGGKALIFNNSTSGGTIRHLTSSGNSGSASLQNCINNGAASGAITVSGFIIKADSQGNTRTGTATIAFSNGIYEVASAAEAGTSNTNVVNTVTTLRVDGSVLDSASVAYNRDSSISGMNWWAAGARPRSAGAVFRDRGIHLGARQ